MVRTEVPCHDVSGRRYLQHGHHVSRINSEAWIESDAMCSVPDDLPEGVLKLEAEADQLERILEGWDPTYACDQHV